MVSQNTANVCRTIPMALTLSCVRNAGAAGVSVNALEQAAEKSGKGAASKPVARSATALIVKNLPYSAEQQELQVIPSSVRSHAGAILQEHGCSCLRAVFQPCQPLDETQNSLVWVRLSQ